MDPGVAVIGAGVAGLACAAALRAAGRAVEVFEKSPAPGGRAATRRRGGPEFDHGAPGFAARDTGFAAAVAGWAAAGAVVRWPAGDADQGGPAWCGVPGMRDAVAPLLGGLAPRYGCRVAGLAGSPEGWTLALADGGAAGPYAAVALAVPAPQAAALLGPWAAAFPALAGVKMTPCWTAMAGWEAPLPAPAPPPVLAGTGQPLWRAVGSHGKPGRDPSRPGWVLQAGADWSAARLEAPAEEVGRALLAAFADRLGATLPEPAVLRVHRWRFALAARGAGADCLWDARLGLGLAGDWCRGSGTGAGVEDAWLSGRALAARLHGA